MQETSELRHFPCPCASLLAPADTMPWKERDAVPLELKEIHINLTSLSRSHKTQIAVENELISNTFSSIHHLESQIAPLREEITLTQWSERLWMCLYKHRTSIIYRKNKECHGDFGYSLHSPSETQTEERIIHKQETGEQSWWRLVCLNENQRDHGRCTHSET